MVTPWATKNPYRMYTLYLTAGGVHNPNNVLTTISFKDLDLDSFKL